MRWLMARLFGNLGYVGDGVWRSAQRWHLYPILACLGLKTIINLATRPEKDAQDRFERWFCEKLGITLVEFDNIAPEYKFKDAYKALIEAEKPVLIHCEGGQDRTGGLVGLYKRIDMEKTYTEIVEDWPVYGTPGEAWLHWFFMYLEGF